MSKGYVWNPLIKIFVIRVDTCLSHGASGTEPVFFCGMWNGFFPVSNKLENSIKELGTGFEDRRISVYCSCSENSS